MRVFKQQYRSRSGKTKISAKWFAELKDHSETMRRLPGFTDKKATEELGCRLEKLVAVRTLGDTPGPELSRWLETLPSDIRKRLAKYGLLDARTVANSNGCHLGCLLGVPFSRVLGTLPPSVFLSISFRDRSVADPRVGARQA